MVLLGKLLPLYGLVVLGWALHRFCGVRTGPVGRFLFYFVGPVFVALSLTARSVSFSALGFSAFTYALCCGIGTFTFWWLRKAEPKRRAIGGFAVGSANSGYFGIPVLTALFGVEVLPVAVLGALGFTFYENSLGYYFAARGRYSYQDSLRNIARLPLLYATALGLYLGSHGYQLSPSLHVVYEISRGAYIVLGMSLIGIACGSLRFRFAETDLIKLLIRLKFTLWPCAVISVLLMNRLGLVAFSLDQVRVLSVFAIAPLPAISVAVASVLDLHAEQTATAVLFTTLLSLAAVPLAVVLSGLMGAGSF